MALIIRPLFAVCQTESAFRKFFGKFSQKLLTKPESAYNIVDTLSGHNFPQAAQNKIRKKFRFGGKNHENTFALSAAGNTTRKRAIPKKASRPEPSGKTFPTTSPARFAASPKTCLKRQNNEKSSFVMALSGPLWDCFFFLPSHFAKIEKDK